MQTNNTHDIDKAHQQEIDANILKLSINGVLVALFANATIASFFSGLIYLILNEQSTPGGILTAIFLIASSFVLFSLSMILTKSAFRYAVKIRELYALYFDTISTSKLSAEIKAHIEVVVADELHKRTISQPTNPGADNDSEDPPPPSE